MPECIFPFSKHDVSQRLGGETKRAGWYLQQLLKLYAPLVIPGIGPRVLVVDADTVFINPVSFVDRDYPEHMLFNVGTEHHQPYFDHMARLELDPPLKRFHPQWSGICHHMLLRREIVRQLVSAVERKHNGMPFWEVFLKQVDPVHVKASGASEFEIYFNFCIANHPASTKIRHLKWRNVDSLDAIDSLARQGYHYVSNHWYARPSSEQASTALESTKHAIVFIHIGPELPAYLLVALKQARLFHSLGNEAETCRIILVCNRSAAAAAGGVGLLGVELEYCEDIAHSPEHAHFMRNTTLDPNFRCGFWRHASERFFYLQGVMSKCKLSNVFHLESDNMIYMNLSAIAQALQQRETFEDVAATFDNDERVIPGLIFFRNQHGMDRVARGMADAALSGQNDMVVLAKLKRISHLPIVCREYVSDQHLQAAAGQRARNPSLYAHQVEQLGCVFDAAAFGQYLGGADQRNSPATHDQGPGFINESCVVDPSKLTFEWHRDAQQRLVPWCVYDQSIFYPLVNLHIHCKDLAQFASVSNE